ncbi:ABC transporter permease [Thalassotalea crassostreae]|uniref:ABC transporter permease n=1 Tax=Thalassotalea crassostreae TaxID=1763536 RepID=UPI0008380FE1|nr:ABC transporter permease [Thalassotalea crassostreae]
MLLANYFVTGWRNTVKNKLFSSINIFGLAIGLAACTLILLFVRYEMNFDNTWTDADKINRMHIVFSIPGRDPMPAVSTPGPAMEALKKDFSEIEYAARIANSGPTIKHNGQVFVEPVKLVDADFNKVFNIKALKGDIDAALQDNHSLVLNETVAKKYFGDEDPIGQVLTLDFDQFKRDYKVAAVIADISEQSQLELPAFVVIDEKDWSEQPWRFEAWFSVNSQLYFKTKNADDVNKINARLADFVNNNFPQLPMGGDDAKASDFIEMSAMNIKDLHLKAVGFGEMREQGNQSTVITFSAIAVLILLIASINFMNLSTARASQRAKEVSLRKVMGASRGNLIAQFLGESVLMTLISVVIALGIIELALPLYNEVLNKELVLDYNFTNIGTLIGLALFVGVIGGLYPAFVLSGFRPATVLKANKSAETGASLKLRAALVILQFTVSIGLFISTGVVYSQMQYAENMDAGYNKDNMLIVHRLGRDAANEKHDVLIKEVERLAQANKVTWSGETPGNTNENNTTLRTPDMTDAESIIIGQRNVGYNFFNTYDIKLLTGRSYDKNRNDIAPTTDQLRAGETFNGSIIMNESALRRLGLGSPEEALGKIVVTGRGDPGENLEANYQVIGVVPDIHFDSLKSTIRPEVYFLQAEWGDSLSVQFSGDPKEITAAVEKVWQQQVPDVPFSYSFVEDDIAEQYQNEQGEAKMFAAFSALAILVACLGLFGLASFTADRRTKEIGIRKVMGAGVFDIVKLLVWQFSKPVLIANIIAWPIAFWLMSDWLEVFVYRIDNSVILGISVIAALFALFIAWATVASNSYRVARSNPIKALRYE